MAMRKRNPLLLAILCVLPVLVLFVIWYTGVLGRFGFGRDTATKAGELSVYFLDVGQGDSTLLTDGNTYILIAAGADTAERDLVARLENFGVRHLDLLILTHPDGDHTGGTDGILEKITVDRILVPRGDVLLTEDAAYRSVLACADGAGVPVTSVRAGEVRTVGALTLEFFAPNSIYYEEINDYSIATRVVFGETSFLFTGDAGVTSEAEMTEKYGKRLESTVYHAGHHGAATSTSEPFLAMVSPEYAVISCGAGNTYGHPRAETLDLLEKYHVTYFRTDEEGTVILRSDGKTVRRGK